MSRQPTKEDYVEMTLESGVAPLELRYAQINSCYKKLPVAYRTFTYLNSITQGVLGPENYSFAADETEQGIRLAGRNIKEAVKAIKSFEINNRKIDFISVRCPACLVVRDDFYEWMKNLIAETGLADSTKLCLEFSQSLLYEDLEKVRLGILNLKILNVRSMMSGLTSNSCPIASLMTVPVDFVVITPEFTALADNRNKGSALMSLIGFIKSLQIEIIADGALNDEQIRLLSRQEVYGYIPSPLYVGSVFHGSLRMTKDAAISQKEQEEFD